MVQHGFIEFSYSVECAHQNIDASKSGRGQFFSLQRIMNNLTDSLFSLFDIMVKQLPPFFSASHPISWRVHHYEAARRFSDTEEIKRFRSTLAGSIDSLQWMLNEEREYIQLFCWCELDLIDPVLRLTTLTCLHSHGLQVASADLRKQLKIGAYGSDL